MSNLWTNTSPFLINVQWQKLDHEITLDKKKEHLASTIKLNGGSKCSVYYDNIALVQGIEYTIPVGQLIKTDLKNADIYNSSIVFTAPLNARIKNIYLSSKFDIKGDSTKADIIFSIVRNSDKAVLCTKTITSSSLITKYSLEPFSAVLLDKADLCNDTLQLDVEYSDNSIALSDIVITVVWEAYYNV